LPEPRKSRIADAQDFLDMPIEQRWQGSAMGNRTRAPKATDAPIRNSFESFWSRLKLRQGSMFGFLAQNWGGINSSSL
jgi:hypothetical protein